MFIKYLNGASHFCMAPDGDPAGGAGGEPTPAAKVGDLAPAADNKTPAGGEPAGGDPAAAPKDADPAPADKAAGGDKDQKDGDKPEQPKGIWSEQWREEYAKDAEGNVDKSKLNRLQRYDSPKALIDALMEAQDKIRSGAAKTQLPKDATPEQVAAWREANGIPKEPEGYLDALPEGLVLGDADKAGAANYLKAMHELNADPAQVAAGLAAYQAAQTEYTNRVAAQDVEAVAAATEQLKELWGPDFPTNINVMKSFIETNFSQDVQEALMNGRLGDEKGTPLLADARVIQAFAAIGRELNPAGTVTHGRGMDNIDTIENQITAYEKRMSTDRTAWFKDEKAQAHYRQLITQREKYQGKTQQAGNANG